MMTRAILIVALVVTVTTGWADAAVLYSQTQSGGVGFPDVTPVVLTFTGTTAPVGDGTLSLIATGGELANANKRLEQLSIEGDGYESPGQPSGWFLPINFLDGAGGTPLPVTIPLAQLSTYTADGQVLVSIVRPGFLAGGTFDVTLEYDTVPEPASLALLTAAAVAFVPRRRRT